MSDTFQGAIGIDLGTTSCRVGVHQNSYVEVIANDMGDRATPSYVAFTDDNETLIGAPAKNQAGRNPTNTIFDVKLFMGKQFSSPSVQSNLGRWPFKLTGDINDAPTVEVEYGGSGLTKQFSPEQLASMLLGKMKNVSEDYLGKPVSQAVIAVPAYFTNQQRDVLKHAGELAGLQVIRVINEPFAAAVAYGLHTMEGVRQVLVVSLGGRALDVTVLSIDGGAIEVKAIDGESNVGGDVFTDRLVAHFVDDFKRKYDGLDPTSDLRSMFRLRNAAERAKHTLSSSSSASVELDSFFDSKDFYCSVSRDQFNALCDDVFHQSLPAVERALTSAGLQKDSTFDVLLAGGAARTPKWQALLEAFLGGKELNRSINPEEVVVYGAASHAQALTRPVA